MEVTRENGLSSNSVIETDSEIEPEIASNSESKSLPWKIRIAFSVGHVLNDLCASMWFTYLLVFFHFVLQFDNSLAGIVLLIGQVADGIATPFVGLEVGNLHAESRHEPKFREGREGVWSKCCNLKNKMGPRKSWHLFGTFCVMMSFPFIFLPCVGCSSSSQWSQVIYFAAFVVIFQFGWASVQVSHLSLIPVLAKDEHTRTDLTALRYSFTVVSNVTIYVITWVTLGVSGETERVVGPEDAVKFRNVVLTALAIGAFFTLIFHMGVDGRIESESQDMKNQHNRRHTLMNATDWLKEKQFYQVGGLYMSTRLFFNLSQIYLPLWIQDTLALGGSTLATAPLALFISGFLASLVMGALTKFVGRKVVYLIGAVIGISACVLVWFGQGEFFRIYGVYGVAILFGAGGSTMLITSLAVTADLIGPHVESGAFVYGAMSFTDKLSNGIAVMAIQYLHPCSGCCVGCRPYYVFILALVCGGAALLSLICLATLIPYDIGIQPKGYQPIPNHSDESDAGTPEPPISDSISVLP